jgi:hypothetical protein
MGIPTSEVGYASATTRRETTEFMMDMWWHWRKKKKRKVLENVEKKFEIFEMNCLTH